MITEPSARPPSGRLMKPSEVAALTGFEPETVVGWARTGRIDATRTPGGQWRIRESAVTALLNTPAPQNENGPGSDRICNT